MSIITMNFTRSEFEAQMLLSNTRGCHTTNSADLYNDPHWCADQIIVLAERIKAERATVAMNLK